MISVRHALGGAARFPLNRAKVECFDCGAAAADYTISRDGGPGHSNWCEVYGKIS